MLILEIYINPPLYAMSKVFYWKPSSREQLGI